MPSTYAHYRFGRLSLPNLPADLRRPILRFRRLYEVGLHGPDLFFYYNPLVKTPTGALGHKFHMQTGQEFFRRVCKRIRLEPSEAALSYLYGVAAHYALDSVCHPYINDVTATGPVTHAALEAEYDRYLMALDGIESPHTYDCSRHIRLTRGECVTVADFYPPATPAQINTAVHHFASYTRLLSPPEGARRAAMDQILKLVPGTVRDMLIPREPNPACTEMDARLMALFTEAMERYPRILNELHAHMSCNAPLDGLFRENFG